MKLGIGAGVDAPKVLASAERVASEGLEIICYSQPGAISITSSSYVTIRFSENPEKELVDDLFQGKTDAAIRGSLPANDTLRYVKQVFGVQHLERIALLQTQAGQRFFLAPVGVDEGWTVEEKVTFVLKSRELAESFGLSPKTVVLSGGRLGDIGRHPSVDASIRDAEEVARITGAEHGEILIENAVKDSGVIIAPDGISGNLIFRTLVFLGGGKGLGAPVVNIPALFVDSSRASHGYDEILQVTADVLRKKHTS